MCLFHKWEEVSSKIGRANYFNQFSYTLREGIKVKLSLERCKKCGKERGYITDQYGEKEQIAVCVIL